MSNKKYNLLPYRSTRHRKSGQEVFNLLPAFRCNLLASRQVSLFSNLPYRWLPFPHIAFFSLI